MSDLKVVKLNEGFMRVSTDDVGVLANLYSYFKFKSPSFNPYVARKTGWDGYVRLYNKNKKVLPLGLLYYLKTFCDKFGYTADVDQSLFVKRDKDGIIEWLDSQVVTDTKGNEITLHWYQREIFLDFIYRKRLTAVAATAAGKSLVAYLAFKYFVDHLEENSTDKMLIVLTSVHLLKQIREDFISYSHLNHFPVDDYLHLVRGESKRSEKSVIASTWQAIYKEPDSYFSPFTMLIGDECHEFSGQSLQSIGMKAVNASDRLGMTATLQSNKCHRLQICSMFGKPKKYVGIKALQDEGKAAKSKIFIYKIKYNEDDIRYLRRQQNDTKHIKTLAKGQKWKKEYDYIIANEKRNRLICELADSLEGNTLVLFNYVEKHGDLLKKIFDEHSSKDILYFIGNVSADDRGEHIDKVEKSDNNIILASYGTFYRGINVKNLHNIILGAPVKSMIRVLQSFGRGVRLHESKDYLRFYDLGDVLTMGKTPNKTLDHQNQRIKYYENEGLTYEEATIMLDEGLKSLNFDDENVPKQASLI